MAEPLAELIGKIIHNCGVLEFFTNNTIRALSKANEFPSFEIMGLARRVRILRKLLIRSKILTPDIDSLLTEILEVAKDRNLVAHNPIASNDKDGTNSYLLVVRPNSGFPPQIDTLDSTRLEAMRKRSGEAVANFNQLIQGARQFEPHSP